MSNKIKVQKDVVLESRYDSKAAFKKVCKAAGIPLSALGGLK